MKTHNRMPTVDAFLVPASISNVSPLLCPHFVCFFFQSSTVMHVVKSIIRVKARGLSMSGQTVTHRGIKQCLAMIIKHRTSNALFL